MVTQLSELCDAIVKQYQKHSYPVAFTIAISGIDASGKGYISRLLHDEIEAKGYKVATINIDPWHNPISERLQKQNPGENFYDHAFRWHDLFTQLIFPLQKNRNIHLETMLIRTNADEYYSYTYDYKEIDILLVEGIFLFRKEFLSYYDWKIWIDCSFENAMKRAIQRNVEKLDEQQLIQDYNTYYYPAQLYHFKNDNPEGIADFIFANN